MSQKRIEFIDLTKGICILFIVLGHTGANIAIPGISDFIMPAFFVLSGLFFKDNEDFKAFAIKKPIDYWFHFFSFI